MEHSFTLKSVTLSLMKHVYNRSDDFTSSCVQKSMGVLETYDISCSDLAISLGNSSIFKGLISSASRKEFLAACYKAFYRLNQNLGVFTPQPFLLRDECLQLVKTFDQEAEKYHYTLPDLGLSEESFKSKVNKMVREFVTEDSYFQARFGGHPPQTLVTALRDYELGFEINFSLDDLAEYLWNNIE